MTPLSFKYQFYTAAAAANCRSRFYLYVISM